MAIVLSGWESHLQGEGPQLMRYLKVRACRMLRPVKLGLGKQKETRVKSFRRSPYAVKACAAERGAESLTQSGGARRNAPGSSD